VGSETPFHSKSSHHCPDFIKFRKSNYSSTKCFHCDSSDHKSISCPFKDANGDKLYSGYKQELPNAPVSEPCIDLDTQPERKSRHRERDVFVHRSNSPGSVDRNATRARIIPSPDEPNTHIGDKGMFVYGLSHDVEIKCLLDNGSPRNIMSIKTFDKIDADERPELCDVPLSTRLWGVGGAELKVFGKVTLPLQVGRNTYMVETYVCDVSDEMLIGMPFLRMYGGTIDCKNFKLILNGERIPCYDIFSRPLSAAIRTKVDVTLDPGKEYIVPGTAHYRGYTARQALMSGTKRFVEQHHVLVARVMIDTYDTKDVPTRLYNIGSDPVTIDKGTLIAQLQPVDAVYDDSVLHDLCVHKMSSDDTCVDVSDPDNIPEHLQNMFDESKVGLNENDQNQLVNLLCDYSDVFSTGPLDLGKTDVFKHDIKLTDTRPMKHAPRRMSEVKQTEADRQIQQCVDMGLVKPSNSAWAAPIVMVRKKDNTLRMCIDYRVLNDKTVKDAYPLPNTAELFDSLSGSKWFSTLDLASGYYQVENTPRAREYSAFTSRKGLFEWTCMPFGLCNAPATFSRLMDRVLTGLKWEISLVYLDDIIVFSSTPSEMIERLRSVFDRLRQAKLKLKPSKCHLFKHEVEYLGHVISERGIATDPAKVERVKNWPVPKSVHDVRTFTGFANYYRRYVPDFASTAKPLYRLTDKTIPFDWTYECQQAFDALRIKLITAPILSFPQQEGQMILDTDASNVGIGCVLSQVQDGVEKVLAYGSKCLSKEERNYCTTRLELLAIVTFTCQFRHYLLGRPILVRTDHSSLRWLVHMKNAEGQLARWFEKLAEYNMTIEHRPGKEHSNADGMSRRPCPKSCPCKITQPPTSNKSTQCDALSVSKIVPCEDVSPFLEHFDTVLLAPESDLDDSLSDAPHDSQNDSVELVLSMTLSDVDDSLSDSVQSSAEREGENIEIKHVVTGWTWEELREAQEEDPDISPFLEMKSKGWERPKFQQVSHLSLAGKSYWHQWSRLEVQQGVLVRKFWSHDSSSVWFQTVLPSKLQKFVLENLHDSSGHFGFDKTYKRVQRRFCWYKMQEDIKLWCKTCLKCAKHGRPQKKAKASMGCVRSGAPMERVCIDVMGPLQETDRHNLYILVIQDTFTKWVEAYPMENEQSITIANVLVSEWVTRHGTPYELYSDKGAPFTSGVFEEMCKILDIDKTKTSGYRPQANGMVEHFNSTLQKILKTTSDECHFNWDIMIPLALMGYRASPHSSTGQTPNFMIYGREIIEPVDLVVGKEPGVTEIPSSEFCIQLKQNLFEAHRLAREALGDAFVTSKKEYNKNLHEHSYKLCDSVLLQVKGIKKPPRGKVRKFMPNYEGPYYVIAHVDPHMYVIQEGPRSKSITVHHDRLKPYQQRDAVDISWVQKQILKHKTPDADPLPADPLIVSSTPDTTPSNSPRRQSKRTTQSPDRLGDWVTGLVNEPLCVSDYPERVVNWVCCIDS